MTANGRVNLLDLTIGQVEELETELGKPFDQWDELPSKVRLLRRAYEVYHGEPEGTRRDMTLRELTALVDLGTAEDAETANPTPARSGG